MTSQPLFRVCLLRDAAVGDDLASSRPKCLFLLLLRRRGRSHQEGGEAEKRQGGSVELVLCMVTQLRVNSLDHITESKLFYVRSSPYKYYLPIRLIFF